MTVRSTPDITFPVGSVDVEIPFVMAQRDASGALVPIPDALTATVTWVAADGTQRPLTLIAPSSAVFAWYTTAREFVTPHTEVGRCRVNFPSGAVFWTNTTFTVEVTARF